MHNLLIVFNWVAIETQFTLCYYYGHICIRCSDAIAGRSEKEKAFPDAA